MTEILRCKCPSRDGSDGSGVMDHRRCDMVAECNAIDPIAISKRKLGSGKSICAHDCKMKREVEEVRGVIFGCCV